MSISMARIKIIGIDVCPLYSMGDEFKLTENSLLPPFTKPACLILIKDIIELVKMKNVDKGYRYVFDCSGCTGLARLEFKTKEINTANEGEKDLLSIIETLKDIPFFKALNNAHFEEMKPHLHVAYFDKGDIILLEGEAGKNIYIIASGKATVQTEDGVYIATIEKGDIFGEMSLISGDPVSATVKASEPLTTLFLEGRYFKEKLSKIPSVQKYITQLLSRRIAKSNIARCRTMSSGITGNLAEIPPAELMQALHINQKTGVLLMKTPLGLAAVSFRGGKLIRAKFRQKKDKEAFFEILKFNRGRFKFSPELPPEETRANEIDNFLKLLMEGESKK